MVGNEALVAFRRPSGRETKHWCHIAAYKLTRHPPWEFDSVARSASIPCLASVLTRSTSINQATKPKSSLKSDMDSPRLGIFRKTHHREINRKKRDAFFWNAVIRSLVTLARGRSSCVDVVFGAPIRGESGSNPRKRSTGGFLGRSKCWKTKHWWHTGGRSDRLFSQNRKEAPRSPLDTFWLFLETPGPLTP